MLGSDQAKSLILRGNAERKALFFLNGDNKGGWNRIRKKTGVRQRQFRIGVSYFIEDHRLHREALRPGISIDMVSPVKNLLCRKGPDSPGKTFRALKEKEERESGRYPTRRVHERGIEF